MAKNPNVDYIWSLWRSAVKSKPIRAKVVGKRAIPIIEKLLKYHTVMEVVNAILGIPSNERVELYDLLDFSRFQAYFDLFMAQRNYGKDKIEAPVIDNFSSAFERFIVNYLLPYRDALVNREITYIDLLIKFPIDDMLANWWRATDPVLSKAARMKGIIPSSVNKSLRRKILPLVRKRSRLKQAMASRNYLLSTDKYSWLKKVIDESLEVLEEYNEIS